jgi:hypothetical protein
MGHELIPKTSSSSPSGIELILTNRAGPIWRGARYSHQTDGTLNPIITSHLCAIRETMPRSIACHSSHKSLPGLLIGGILALHVGAHMDARRNPQPNEHRRSAATLLRQLSLPLREPKTDRQTFGGIPPVEVQEIEGIEEDAALIAPMA